MIVMTVIPLNIRSREVRADLTDSQRLHTRIMRMFPHADRTQNRVLYRVDGAMSEPMLVLQSEVQPDAKMLPVGYVRGTLRMRDDLADAYEQIQGGHRLRFRLRANVTKKLATHQTAQGKRVAITDAVAQMEWLIRKGDQAGFVLLPDPFAVDGYAVTVIDEGREYGLRRHGEDVAKLTHVAIRFEGVLTVSDAVRFRDALRQGIGPAKAYGFGLLSVTPA